MRPEDSAARCAANEEDEDDEGTADDDEEDDEDNEDDDDPSVASDMVTSPLVCSSGVSDSSTMRFKALESSDVNSPGTTV